MESYTTCIYIHIYHIYYSYLHMYIKIYMLFLFLVWLVLISIFFRFIIAFCVLIGHFFLLLSSIALYDYPAVCFYILPSNIWAVSSFWLFWLMLLWTSWQSFCGDRFSFLFEKQLQVDLWGHWVDICWTEKKKNPTKQPTSQWLCPCTQPAAVSEHSGSLCPL